jgi:hypothetical protein
VDRSKESVLCPIWQDILMRYARLPYEQNPKTNIYIIPYNEINYRDGALVETIFWFCVFVDSGLITSCLLSKVIRCLVSNRVGCIEGEVKLQRCGGMLF